MSSARLGRGTKSKAFLYVCIILVLVTVIYLFHGTQSQLDDVKKAASICAQQQESLSAQLQVIFEYKLRLEKSLQKEKSDHRQTKEKLLAQLEEEKQSKQKENLEDSNKYNTLQEKYDLLQNEHKTLNDELNELKNKQTENNEAQEILKKQAEELKTQLEIIKLEKDKYIEKLKIDNQKLLIDNEELLKNNMPNGYNDILQNKNTELENKVKDLVTQLQSCTPKDKYEEDAANEVQENHINDNQQFFDSRVSLSGIAKKNSKVTNSSTTPFINPQAVIDHDANHDMLSSSSSSAKPMMVDPLMKSVLANIPEENAPVLANPPDENAAIEEEKEKLVLEDKTVPTMVDKDKIVANVISGNDVIGAPQFN